MTGAFLHPFASPARERFITVTRGQGSLIWDSDGKEYVDAMASLWYCAIGHGRQEMADSIAAQVGTLAAYSCFDPFTNEPADRLAELLVGLTPIADARVFFCGSGSEAVDTAMKLARLAHVLSGHPERTLIISRMRGYHGTNYGGTTAQGLPPNKEGWGPLLPDVVQVPSDDVEALAQLMAERSHEIAAVITEPVQGAGGVWPAEDGLPRIGPPPVRSARCAADLRRGHLGLRPPRPLVRRTALRRHARHHDVREGGHLRLPAARRRVRRSCGARPARGRSRRTC